MIETRILAWPPSP